eukprot:2437758-Alexandrium_andersonii.AAC.1
MCADRRTRSHSRAHLVLPCTCNVKATPRIGGSGACAAAMGRKRRSARSPIGSPPPRRVRKDAGVPKTDAPPAPGMALQPRRW